MAQSNLKADQHQDAVYIMRLLSCRRSDWPAELSLYQLDSPHIEALLDYIAASKDVRASYGSQMAIWSVLLAVWCGLFPSLMLVPAVMALLCLSVSIILFRATPYRYAIYALTQTDDMRVLPTLIQATRHKWGWHPQVRDAILRLLKQVTEEHVGLLNDAEQKRLWQFAIESQIVTENYDPEPALLTLQALATIGNHTTLARMQRFARYDIPFHSRLILLKTAQELIPIMEARLQRQQSPQTLLRAADIPAAQPEMLLRPTYATTPEPSGQLLRASTEEAREP